MRHPYRTHGEPPILTRQVARLDVESLDAFLVRLDIVAAAMRDTARERPQLANVPIRTTVKVDAINRTAVVQVSRF